MSEDMKKPANKDAAPDPKPSKKPVVFTRELLESYGFKVPEPRGEGFVVVPAGRPIRPKPSPKLI